MDWHPRKKRLGDDINDPYGSEIFTDGNLNSIADALVSETLQNAIDAGRGVERGDTPVRVEFRLRNNHRALKRERATRWFGSLRPHLEAAFGGETSRGGRLPDPDQTCPYLTIEDFGTCGLTGDPASDVAAPGAVDGRPRNHFVDFLRSDGRTGKTAGEAGSWGIGKNVFPLSSRIRSFLALTVRADDRRALAMGKAILNHRSHAGADWQPSCYCCAAWPEGGGAPVPAEDLEALDELRDDFGLRRKAGEPGLSLVLPYVTDAITIREIGDAVLRRYGWAILTGEVEVELDGGRGDIEVLDAATAAEHASDKQEIRESLALKTWAKELPAGKHRSLPRADGCDWKTRRVPDKLRGELKDLLDAGERVAVRVPLEVPRAHGRVLEKDELCVYVAPREGPSPRPEFVRGHLTLPSVKGASAVSGVRTLVVIRNGPLADLLRAAEPPSHQSWEQDSRNFRDAYRGHAGYLTFVKKAAKEILSQVRETPVGGSLEEGMDCFYLPKEGGVVFRDKKLISKSSGGNGPPQDPEKVEEEEVKRPPRRRRLTLEQRDDGFSLLPGDPEAEPFQRIFVQVAYDVEAGNAFKVHEEADFDLMKPQASGITIETDHAAEVEAIEPNRLAVTFHRADFEVRVTGFDRHRDLRVGYRPSPVDEDEAEENGGSDQGPAGGDH